MIDWFYGVLAGLGYSHPVHPTMTHMPIGLVTGALTLVIVALIARKERLALSARHAFIVAFAFAIPTILLGVMDWIHFYHAAWIPAIKAKIILASILLVLLVVGMILGRRGNAMSPVMIVIYALSFLTAVGLGYFGGNLVYGEAPAAASPPAAQASRPPASAVEIRAGRAVFTANCQACHANGGNVIVATLPLKSSAKLDSFDSFVAFVRDPKMPDGSAGNMPTFTPGILSDSDARSLYAYILDARKGWR
jgi:mono/diheme cytochrome c family protein